MSRFLRKNDLTFPNLVFLSCVPMLGYLGCAGSQGSRLQSDLSAPTGLADSLTKKQVVTRVQNNNFKKTMDYPYLLVKFRQNDTEVELLLDPQSTNLTLDLARGPDGDLQVLQGDSVLTQDTKAPPDSAMTKEIQEKEDLTDEIISDINLAQKLFYEKRYNEALKVLQASLQKKPSATAYALGGSIYYVNGDIDEAVKAWARALKINPDLQEVKELIMRYKN